MSSLPPDQAGQLLHHSGLRTSFSGTLEVVFADPELAHIASSRWHRRGRAEAGEPTRSARSRTDGFPREVTYRVLVAGPRRWRLEESEAGRGPQIEIVDGTRRWLSTGQSWEEVVDAPAADDLPDDLIGLMLDPRRIPDAYAVSVIRAGEVYDLDLLPEGGVSELLWPGAERVMAGFAPDAGILVFTAAFLAGEVYASSRWQTFELGEAIDPSQLRPPSDVAVRRVRIRRYGRKPVTGLGSRAPLVGPQGLEP